jgi:cobalt/nickel transport system permease protein
VVAASAAASAELAISGTVPLNVALPAMVSVHMVIGVGEALITAAVVSAVLVARPDLVKTFDLPRGSVQVAGAPRTGKAVRVWSFVAVGVVLAAALALFVSPFASGAPDGLESVAQAQATATPGETSEAAESAPVWNLSPMGDYRLPGIESERLSTALAGLIGTLAMFGIVIAGGRLLGRRRTGSS